VSVPIDGRHVVVAGLHCTFLAATPDGRFRCTVYDERFERAPWCHSAKDAAPLGYLADDCPYGIAAGVQPGMGKTILPPAEFDAAWPAILRRIRSWGVPSFVNRDALLREIERREGDRWVIEPWPGLRDTLRVRPAR
jgi:hypothetical protein